MERGYVYAGDLVAAGPMLAAGLFGLWLGVSAEQESHRRLGEYSPIEVSSTGVIRGWGEDEQPDRWS